MLPYTRYSLDFRTIYSSLFICVEFFSHPHKSDFLGANIGFNDYVCLPLNYKMCVTVITQVNIGYPQNS